MRLVIEKGPRLLRVYCEDMMEVQVGENGRAQIIPAKVWTDCSPAAKAALDELVEDEWVEVTSSIRVHKDGGNWEQLPEDHSDPLPIIQAYRAGLAQGQMQREEKVRALVEAVEDLKPVCLPPPWVGILTSDQWQGLETAAKALQQLA